MWIDIFSIPELSNPKDNEISYVQCELTYLPSC